jgi:hypothetical protein
MTSIEATPITPDEAEQAQRAEFVKGLRALADVLEGHAEVPLPFTGTASALCISFLCRDDARSAMAAAARAFPCSWDKRVWGDETAYFDMVGSLHGLQVKLNAFRDAVCERVVTGTHEVTEVVKDPEALAAVPEVEVTRVVEDVEWICSPIMSAAAPVENGAAA